MTPGEAPRTAVVLANPAARRALPPRALEVAADAIRERDWHVTIEETSSTSATRERAAHHAANGVDAILACGGDGTLLTVVNGVLAANVGYRVAVGVVPAGTANVWAAEAGVPRSPQRALALLASGARRRMDVGVARIGDEDSPRVRFLLVCGVGLDAAVIEAVDARPAWKRRLGRLAFGPPALAALLRSRAVEARIDLDGEELHAARLILGLASNNGRYGGVAALASASAADDGLLEVTTFEASRSPIDRGRLVGELLRGRFDQRRVAGVTHRQARTIMITPAAPLPVEVDGDSIGRCGPDAPLHIEVERQALTMIVGPRA